MLDKQFITGYWLLVAGLGCVAWYFIIIYFTHPSPSLLALLCRSYAKAMQGGETFHSILIDNLSLHLLVGGQGVGKKRY